MKRATSRPLPLVAAAVSLLVALERPVRAEPGDPPPFCHPARPTPPCTPLPPGAPPPWTDAEAQAMGARAEAEYAAENVARLEREEAAARDAVRRAAYQERVESARPPDIAVRMPLVDVTAAFRFGAIADTRYGHAGPELGIGYRFDSGYTLGRRSETFFGVDASVALLQTWAGRAGSWGTVGLAPAFSAGFVDRGVTVRVRFGPDLLVPVDARATTPGVLVGGALGVGVAGHVASLPNGGYVAWGVEVRGALRAGVAGPPSALRLLRGGVDTLLSVRLAF